MNIVKLKETYGDVLWAGKKRRLGLPLSVTTYIMTSKKLITRVGLLNLREDNTDLYRVMDYSMLLPLGQRIFRCGTLKINSKDMDNPVKFLESIKDPRGVYNILQDAVEAERNKYAVRGRDMYGAAGNEHDVYGDTHHGGNDL